MLYLRKKPIYENHPFNAKCEGNLTKCTVYTYIVTVKAFFNFLLNEKYITVDLMKKFKMIKPENKLIVPLTESKVSAIDALFNLRAETGSRNLCIFYLMLDAGLRSSEMLNLQITNVQFNDDLIFASQGKGSKDRTIPLSPHLATQNKFHSNIYKLGKKFFRRYSV